ncbi:MAG: sodium-dependent transporter [Pseudomonadota bacterium]
MAASNVSWSSRTTFIFAAIGSAVGLGNIWKFPYEAGEGGGGAFVLIYILFVFAIGVPVMIAELMLGRRGQHSPPKSMEIVAREEGRSQLWQVIGWSGVIGAFFVLSFYSVIAGWTLFYVYQAATGALNDITAIGSGAMFNALLSSPVLMTIMHGLFMAITVFVVGRGVKGGLEVAVTWLMPVLFVLLIVLVIFSLQTGDAGEAISFLFSPDFSKLTANTILQALGQAFFSLSVGLGAMLAYGSYVPKDVSLPRSAVIIASADTGVAILSGLAIFPIVFAFGLQVGSGPGLIFETLPVAFAQMPFGSVFGAAFFILLSIAALTSSISLLEPMVAWLEEHKGIARAKSAVVGGGLCFLVGILTVFSFSNGPAVTVLGKTPFDHIDFLTNNWVMPLGGLLIAVFAGWLMARKTTVEEVDRSEGAIYRVWHFMVRYLCPVALSLIFLQFAFKVF